MSSVGRIVVLAIGLCGCQQILGIDDTVVAGGDGDGDGDGDGGNGVFEPLISVDWNRPAGTEGYRCATLTLTEDIYVAELRVIAPVDTHHAVLTYDNPGAPDDEVDCDSGTGTSSGTMVFAFGIGSDAFSFPPGVAVKLPAGQQLRLNLHTFNVGDVETSGTSGIEIRRIAPAEVTDEAEMVFVGPVDIQIPPMTSGHTETGGCTLDKAVTIFDVWPHMHQLGVQMRVEHQGSVVHDQPYSFDQQIHHPITVTAGANDRIDVTCTYDNPTGNTVGFGESVDDEICFAGLYLYPKLDGGPFCL